MDDELELYLDMRVEKNVKDPIQWWVEKQKLYPCLSCMVLDFLTIPGTLFRYITYIPHSHPA